MLVVVGLLAIAIITQTRQSISTHDAASALMEIRHKLTEVQFGHGSAMEGGNVDVTVSLLSH
jgi:hypothetical protein